MSGLFLTAIGLLCVIEGALYALFPAAMQRMMLQMLTMPPEMLRRGGLVIAFAGFALIYFLHHV